MNNVRKGTITALTTLALIGGSSMNAFATTNQDFGSASEQSNQIINDDKSSNFEIPVQGVIGNAYDTDGDGKPDIDIDGDGNPDKKPEFGDSVSKINVSVPLKMKFAVVGNLVGSDKFTAPTYEVINSGTKPVDISVLSFNGDGSDYVPVVDESEVQDEDSADKHIALGLQLGDESSVKLKTSGFSEAKLGNVDKGETKTLKFSDVKYGKDFSKFKRASDNKNTSYNMTWKITQQEE
ncbi:hypothetical protein CYK83_15715 [Clostridium perfringens]|nr:hypothetical protein CYK83_15715 [Clostridium perfringens]HAT4219207.1 hypothetical protein [Clostridium perfringens]